MANLQFDLPFTKVACTVGGAKTIVQLVAPANQRVKIVAAAISFDGILTTGMPVGIRILRQSTAGTMSALTPINTNAVSETIQSTAQFNASAEPTVGNVLWSMLVHPQQGILHQLPFAGEYICPGGGRVGLETNVTAGQSAVNCSGFLTCEE